MKNIEKILEQRLGWALRTCLDVAGDVAADVLSAEVDVAADGEGHTADVLDDEGHSVDRPAVAGAGLVEGAPDEGGRVREVLDAVIVASNVTAPAVAVADAAARTRREATVAT